MITVTSNHRCVFELYVLHKHETVSATDLCLLLRFQTLITVPIIMYFCISIVKSRRHMGTYYHEILYKMY